MNRELDSLQTKKSYNKDYIDEVKEDVEKMGIRRIKF